MGRLSRADKTIRELGDGVMPISYASTPTPPPSTPVSLTPHFPEMKEIDYTSHTTLHATLLYKPHYSKR